MVWLLKIGLPIGLVWVVVMVAASQFLGWGNAYEMMTGIKTPVGSKYPGWAWTVSLGGWMLVPAFIGGVAGAMIGGRLDRRRSKDTEELKNTIIHGFKGIGGP